MGSGTSTARQVSTGFTAGNNQQRCLGLCRHCDAVYLPLLTHLRLVQDALDIVEPGDTIEIESGDYYEDISTKVSYQSD